MDVIEANTELARIEKEERAPAIRRLKAIQRRIRAAESKHEAHMASLNVALGEVREKLARIDRRNVELEVGIRDARFACTIFKPKKQES